MNLEVNNLDFDAVKASIINFLKAKPQFSDYDFEGSGLNHLIDGLAYTGYLNGFYFNMVANEIFLDTSVLRSSVVSNARHLNYTPRSTKSAKALIDITVQGSISSEATLTIPRGTSFKSSVDTSLSFVTLEPRISGKDSNYRYVFKDVEVTEGRVYYVQYQVTEENPVFLIPNADVDISTLSVVVTDSSSNLSQTVYELNTDITTINSESTVFFIQENEQLKYEITFGDGILGKALSVGNIVNIEYVLSSGPAANNASIFTLTDRIGTFPPSNITITTVSSAFGGVERESIESIRRTAPKMYESQNRMVTEEDFRTLIPRDFPIVDSISVWGGEEADPPRFGKVFLSIKPKNGYVLTASMKERVIRDVLRTKNMVAIEPIIIDPEYTFILVDSEVFFDAKSTTKTSTDIVNLVRMALNTYNDDEIGQFEKILKYSRLINRIDEADPSITNNSTFLRMQKRLEVVLNIFQSIDIDFSNSIKAGSLISNNFVISQDPVIRYSDGDIFRLVDSSGVIKIQKKAANTDFFVDVKDAGTVNYITGKIKLEGFRPFSLVGNLLILTATSNTLDIFPKRNTILLLENADINIQAFQSTL